MSPSQGGARGFDTIYLVDCSRSMGDKLGDSKVSKLELTKAALVSVLSNSNFDSRDRVGVIGVNTNIFGKPMIRHVFAFAEIRPLVDGKKLPIDKIMLLKNDGGTALIAGMQESIKLLTNKNTRNDLHIFVITDFHGNDSMQQPEKLLAVAKKTPAHVHFLVLGEGKSNEKFKLVSETTGGRVQFARNQFDLEQLMFGNKSPLEHSSHTKNVLVPPVPERPHQSETTREMPAGLPRVTPKRHKPETLEEIQRSANELTAEYVELEKGLREGKMSQIEFTEKYSILQYELHELRQCIREERSKLSREITEIALVRNSSQVSSAGTDEALRTTSRNLTELDKRISTIDQ